MADDPISIRADFMKPHEYFLIKPKRTAGDVRYINNVAMSFSGSKGDNKGQLMLGELMFATVVRMLKGWNITTTVTNTDGTTREEPLPFDPSKPEASLDALDGDYFEYLYNAIDSQPKGMTPEQQKNSQSAAMTGSSESQTSSLSQS